SAEHAFLDYLEARNIANAGANHVPDTAHIHAMLVGRQLARQLGDLDVEILPQQLQEREVEVRIVLVAPEVWLGGSAAPLELHRQEDERGAIAALVARR